MTKPQEPAANDESVLIDFVCPNCDEKLRGLEGAIAKCPYCDDWLDAPYRNETAPTDPS